jgi:hypothetical protein
MDNNWDKLLFLRDERDTISANGAELAALAVVRIPIVCLGAEDN